MVCPQKNKNNMIQLPEVHRVRNRNKTESTECGGSYHTKSKQSIVQVYIEWIIKPVSQSCTERTSMAPKQGLTSLVGHTLMADSLEKENEGGEKRRKCHSRNVCSNVYFIRHVFANPVLRDFYRLFGSRISPTTGILYTIHHAYGSVWPAKEAISLALVPCSNVLRMIVKLAYKQTANVVSTIHCTSQHTCSTHPVPHNKQTKLTLDFFSITELSVAVRQHYISEESEDTNP